jgi:hypothetical protein
MEPFEALSLCAEIAIAITGFSGVVLVFADRSGSASTEFDRFLFRTLFTATCIPLGLIAVAFILEASAFERATIWRTCSTIHLVAVSANMLFNRLVVSGARTVEANHRAPRFFGEWRAGAVVVVGALLVMALQLANVIGLHSFWPVLVAVWWAIAVSLLAFVSLLFFARAA